MICYVYVLRSDKDGNKYIGITDNIKRRVTQHKKGIVTSTRNRRPLRLVYIEKYLDRISARKRERYFKTAAGRRFLKELKTAEMVELADTHV